MNKRLGLAIIVLLGLSGAVLWRFAASEAEPRPYTGYVVAHNIYLSASQAGTVREMLVRRGQKVTAGEPAFALDPVLLEAQRDEIRALMAQLRAKEALEKAALLRAEAGLAHARTEMERTAADKRRVLGANATRKGSISRSDLDHALAAAAGSEQMWEAAQHEVAMAVEQVRMAGAEGVQAEARLRGLEQRLRDLAPLCPVDGVVDDVLFQPGEWAMANVPVVSLIPRDHLRVRFYVPQDKVQAFLPGTAVRLACDGCPPDMRATVDFIAERPEYTPPVIYSLSNRERLVFLVEAAPAKPEDLAVGQPMDVWRAP